MHASHDMPVLNRPLEDEFDDHLGLLDVDYVELWVTNAKQAAHYYQTVFGFELTGYSGLETGTRDRASHLLTQGNIRLVLTSCLDGDSPIADFCKAHGDGVKDIGLTVEDVDRAFSESIARGGRAITEPHDLSDDSGTVRVAAIATYGDVVHTLVQRNEYQGLFMPGF